MRTSRDSYFVGVYGRTSVKKIRYGLGGVQNHDLHSGKLDTKDIRLCDTKDSTSNVWTGKVHEIAGTDHVVWPFLLAIPMGRY